MPTAINSAQLDLELAKRKLEEILNREFLFRESAVQQHSEIFLERFPFLSSQSLAEVTREFIYIRKYMPEIISVGTSQIVFQLDGGYVGKTSRRQSQDGPLPQDYYVVNNGRAYSGHSQITTSLFRDLGFEVPEHHYFRVEQTDGGIELKEYGYGMDFVITQDLSERSKFKVEDVEDRHFHQLANGDNIRRELDANLGILRNVYGGNHPQYVLEVNGHTSNDNPDEALRRIFFVVVNSATNIGELVIGDIDHIDFKSKTQTFL